MISGEITSEESLSLLSHPLVAMSDVRGLVLSKIGDFSRFALPSLQLLHSLQVPSLKITKKIKINIQQSAEIIPQRSQYLENSGGIFHNIIYTNLS